MERDGYQNFTGRTGKLLMEDLGANKMNVLQMTMTQKPYHNGIQKLYKFKNGYHMSVICHDGSYGGPYKGRDQLNKWEIAPMDQYRHFIGLSELGWNDDVKGHLLWEEVEQYLEEIACLK